MPFIRFARAVLATLLLRLAGTAADLPVTAGVDLKPNPGLPPLQYTNAGFGIPNYVGAHKLGENFSRMQQPLSPEESARHIVTLPGFHARLWAAEPQIKKPVCLAWDERGRLWISETVDYPNELRPPGEGRDRIVICEDTDGDGVADKFTVFADKLSIPTSITFANGGIIVQQAPDTLFLKSSKGDDHADIRQVLFSGWGTRDTHAGPSNIRWGFDNQIWGVVGYSGFDGTVGGQQHKFAMGFYRFRPDGSKLEFIRSSNNNTWGFAWSEDGLTFGSTANNNAYMYMPVPNRYYEAVSGWSASRVDSIASSQRFFPITEKVRQVDVQGGYTAAAGAALYTARSFPPEYWNRVAFVAEPTGHLVGKFRLAGQGADFTAHNEKSFLASDDEWTAPICAEVGPDGALWVIDWYNYIVQHNPTPQGFSTGRGNAYESPLRDKRHGRIYRVAWDGAPLVKPLNLAKAPPAELVATLKNDNLFWRMHAQRLLVERGGQDVVPGLLRLAADKSVDAAGLNPAAIHALWTLQGLGAGEVNAAALAALKHPSPGVRRAAVNVLPRGGPSVNALLNGGLLNDGDAQVRLAALLALAEMPVSETAGRAVFAALQLEGNFKDRWIPDAAIAAGARHAEGFLKAASAQTDIPREISLPLRIVAAHHAARAPVDSVVPTLLALTSAAPALPLLEGLATGWPPGTAPKLAPGDEARLVALLKSLPNSARGHLVALASRWGRRDLFEPEVAAIARELLAQVADPKAAGDARADAAKQLVGLDDSGANIQGILNEVNPLTPPSLAGGFISALADSRQNETAAALIGHWSKFTPAARRAAVAALLRKPAWASSLLTAVEKKQLAHNDLGADHWQQLKSHPDKGVANKAKRLDSGSVTATSSDMEALVQKLMPLTNEPGDPARGKAVFEATCQVCHTMNGTGGRVGPELTGFGAHPKSEILIAVVDPNRSVEANFRMWTVSTKDGESFAGRLDAETQTSVDILDTTGNKHSIQRKDIAKLEASNLSLMPEGFGALPPDDLKALLEFISLSNVPKK